MSLWSLLILTSYIPHIEQLESKKQVSKCASTGYKAEGMYKYDQQQRTERKRVRL